MARTIAARPDLVAQLDPQVDALDRLVGELRLGVRGPEHYHELESQARRIAWALTAAFRGERCASMDAGER